MPNQNESREYTPEELKKIHAKFKKEFTVEDMIEYVEDDVPKVSADVVLAEIEAMVATAEGPDPNPEPE